MRLVQPENYKFLGELWDVSGLPLSWGRDAVTDFLAGWKVGLVTTFAEAVGKVGRDGGGNAGTPALTRLRTRGGRLLDCSSQSSSDGFKVSQIFPVLCGL